MIAVSYQPTFRDQYFATLSMLFRSPLMFLFSLIFPAGGIFILFKVLQSGRSPVWSEWLLIVFALFSMPMMTALNVWMLGHVDKTARQSRVYSFSDDGLTIQAESFTVTLKWDALNRIQETSGFFIFYTSAYRGYFLPKRSMDESQMGEIRKFLDKVRK